MALPESLEKHPFPVSLPCDCPWIHGVSYLLSQTTNCKLSLCVLKIQLIFVGTVRVVWLLVNKFKYK